LTSKQRNLPQSLWDLFCSLKLTMSLLISLALTSIIGTIIPQGPPPQEYLEQISPAKFKLYQSLGFFDMYHSWWFILLLGLLTANLVSCSIKRLPHIWQTIIRPETVMTSALEQSLGAVVSVSSKIKPELLKEKVAAFLRAEFAEPVTTEVDGAWHLFAQKTPWCRLAVYFVHLSVIVIFIGAIIGSLFGYKGFVNITEGQSIDKVVSRAGKEINLGFSLRCDQFSVAYYTTGAPREFKSILTVLENGKPVPDYTNARIVVNDPLTYKGITFYQSSYGNAGDYFFTVSDLDGKNAASLTVNGTSSATLPDGSSMHVLEATEDVSAYVPGLSGPAAQVEIHPPQGKSETIVVYANHPEQNIQQARERKGSPVLQYKGARKRMYTGLQVAKDPGVWVVWLGCLLMVVGVYAAFFLSHRRIWVRIRNGSVTIGGNASKNQGAFRQYLDQLAEKLTSHLSREEHP